MLETMSEKLINKGRQEGLDKGRQEGRQEGLDKGRQEGLEKGREEILQNIVLNMLEEKHDISYIAKICNITEDKIWEIKNKIS